MLNSAVYYPHVHPDEPQKADLIARELISQKLLMWYIVRFLLLEFARERCSPCANHCTKKAASSKKEEPSGFVNTNWFAPV
jgi:hypothetical protein